MTNEQVKRFLSLFMGKDYASANVGIFEWKEFMEKNHAELWKDYCRCMDVDGKGVLYKVIDLILDPRNLAIFLAEFLLERREEWEWVECPCPPEFKGDVEIKKVCPYCNGTGKIKHPALVWAEKEGL